MTTNAVVIEPPESATASVIWLHGLGADGHDFEPIVPQLPKNLTAHTRFIFPHAPHRPITINGGMIMPGWYDVFGMDLTVKQDAQGIRDSEKILCNYIAEEMERGISTKRIVLAGFSQGGAIVLHTGLRYSHPLGGIVALSTYLPLADTVESEFHTANQQIPIFIAHGQADPVIAFEHGKNSAVKLENLVIQSNGKVITWNTMLIWMKSLRLDVG
ncbi:Phospholipase/Carboxylesterase [Beggiatoa sp. PS]|nr:Phospholipase/Carboxylesterase [Beggiatoa sp. PS]